MSSTIALDLVIVGRNARTVAVPAMFDEGLRRSIQEVGVLQPILVRPHADRYEVVLGGRRRAAALAVGLTQIPAEVREMSDAEVEAAQIAENIQRQAMHPVDQWRAVRELIQDHGYTFEQAGGALGLDDRVMRRMEQMGRLHPTLLKLAEIEQPTPMQLRQIAGSTQKLQAAAARIKDLIVARGDAATVDWHRVVTCCMRLRISRTLALFDVATVKGIAWDEDLFAEPGADDQFTTADVDNFLAAQTKAVNAEVAQLRGANKRHQTAVMKDNRSIAFPAGFKASLGRPDKLRAHEWAFHAVTFDGSVRIETAIDTKAAKAAERKVAAKVALKGIVGALEEPDSTPRRVASPQNDAAQDGAASDDADDSAPPPDAPPRPAFTKRGLALLAAAKDDAVRAALAATPLSVGRAVALLVLALCANNISFGGVDDAHFTDLARVLLKPGGTLADPSDVELAGIAATAIGRMIRFDVPDTHWRASNGAAAEWIGAALVAGEHYARFDTKDFLDTASLAELRRAAEHGGLLSTGNASQLRERLIGRMPQYRPEAAEFGAPSPREAAR